MEKHELDLPLGVEITVGKWGRGEEVLAFEECSEHYTFSSYVEVRDRFADIRF